MHGAAVLIGGRQRDNSDSFVPGDAIDAATAARWIGRELGTYRVVKPLGHGGMGDVYLAERHGQFRQLVAIKILAHGAGTALARRRFIVERQALAGIDHPNIAVLIDSGETPEGVLYLVMEFIKGQAITDYCNQRGLSIRQRVALVVKICRAVQAAHERLVVHRDIKPSNILVTEDGTPKLLDFGIAKLVAAIDEDGETTRTGHRLMSPYYAAPEQFSGAAVSAATDVYALGVLLYELVCGNRPYTIGSGAPEVLYQEVLRSLPKPPSRQIPTGSQVKASMLQAFGVKSTLSLRRTLKGDLDSIILKALRKEPSQRYRTAADFQRDLEHYLAARPVSARPLTRRYRLARFLGRHPLWAVLSASIFISVLAITGLIFRSNIRLAEERDRVAEQYQRAETQAHKAREVVRFLVDSFRAADPTRAQGADISARSILEASHRRIQGELADQIALRSELLAVMAEVYVGLGLPQEALPLAQRAADLVQADDDNDKQALLDRQHNLAEVHAAVGNFEEARDLAHGVLMQRRQQIPVPVRAIGRTWRVYADALGDLGETERALEQHRQLLDYRISQLGENDVDVAASYRRLAGALRRVQRHDESIVALEAASDLDLALGLNRSVDHHGTLYSLATAYFRKAEYMTALEKAEEAAGLARDIFDQRHPVTALSIDLVASIHARMGRAQLAVPAYRESLAMRRETLGELHPNVAYGEFNLALALHHGMDQPSAALNHYRLALGIGEGVWPEAHRTLTSFRLGLATVLADLGHNEEAEVLLDRCLAEFEQRKAHRSVAETRSELAGLALKEGDRERARVLLELALPVLEQAYRESDHELLRARRREEQLVAYP